MRTRNPSKYYNCIPKTYSMIFNNNKIVFGLEFLIILKNTSKHKYNLLRKNKYEPKLRKLVLFSYLYVSDNAEPLNPSIRMDIQLPLFLWNMCSLFGSRGRVYPIWIREQGVGRNKSSSLTQIMDATSNAGGDFHTTYWPQPSFISSRKFYFESSYSTYHELDFSLSDRHVIYWHITIPTDEEGSACLSCHLTFLVKPTLMEIVQTLNPGQPPLPDWVFNGAILGVQGYWQS